MPTAIATRQSTAITHDRAGFGALRAELHDRAADLDLAELWEDLRRAERRAVLQSAGLVDVETTQHVGLLSKADRDAIRGAIHRMSGYASRLRDRMKGEREHPSRELAAHARQAIAEGNQKAALHWLGLIEKGVA